ncbi:MAG: hypothetical protein BZ136_00400 [Methanosphaera sp. rholeuAM74]|nr:MAG: hypothetical protein BZ136_00400 [Methanosphaera sp. rholeuAM74]
MITKNKLLSISMIIFIILILMCNTITAHETNDTTTKLEPNNGKQIKTLSETTEDINSYDQLYDAIENAKTSNQDKYTINLKSGDYNITKQITWRCNQVKTNLTINGENNILDGNNINNFISIERTNILNLNNIHINNTYSTTTATIYNRGILNINNSIIENTVSMPSAANMGGAIVNLGTLTINNTLLHNNSQKTAQVGSGVIYNLANLTIENTTFTDNYCESNGGAIYTTKNISLTNTTFSNNTAKDSGSAIYIASGITQPSIINNTIITNSDTGNSTIIHVEINSELTINNTEITNCQNNVETIYNNGKLLIENTTIKNNVNNHSILNNNILNITNTIINNNTVQNNLIKNTATTNISNSNITNNNNINDNALIDSHDSRIYIYNTEFNNNTANGLFNGSLDDFIAVVNNTYIANNLHNITLNINHIEQANYQEEITYNGEVTISPIYNHTINTGYVYVIKNSEMVAQIRVTEGQFNFTDKITNTTTHNYQFIYNDTPNFEVKSVNEIVAITYPEYEVKINITNTTLRNENFPINIIVENKGNGTGYNLTIENIIPEELTYTNSSSNDYDIHTNTWNIDVIEANTNKTLTINTTTNNTDKFNVTIRVKNPITNETQEITQEVTVLYSDLDINIDYSPNIALTPSNNTIYIKNNGTMVTQEVTINITTKNLVTDEEDCIIITDLIDSGMTKSIALPLPEKDMILYYNVTIQEQSKDKTYHYNFTINNTRAELDVTFDNTTMIITNTGSQNSSQINVTVRSNNTLGEQTEESYTIDSLDVQEVGEIELTPPKNNTYTTYTITVYESSTNTSIEYHYELNTTIIPKIVELMNVTGHAGQMVNITAHYSGISVDEIKAVIFKVNGLTIRDCQIEITDTTITLLNYMIGEKFRKTNYTTLIKIVDKNYDSVSNNSTLYLVKYHVYTVFNPIKTIPGSKVNITAYVYDEMGNKVNTGIVKFKINGKTINITVHVRNGTAQITYQLPQNYRSIDYNLSLVYADNSLYYSNRNNTTLSLEKVDSVIELTNTTYIRKGNFTITAVIKSVDGSIPATSGGVVLKINDKTQTPVMKLTNGTISYTFVVNFRKVNTIGAAYSGNYILNNARRTIDFGKVGQD